MPNPIITKNGVCYDIRNSPFKVEVMGFEFYFSTQLHAVNFSEKWFMKVDWLNDSMHRRFKVNMSLGELALFQLYMQIEKRGFYVKDVYGCEVYECPQEVLFAGSVLKEKGFSKRDGDTTSD